MKKMVKKTAERKQVTEKLAWKNPHLAAIPLAKDLKALFAEAISHRDVQQIERLLEEHRDEILCAIKKARKT